ncbi:MAG: calcium-binding protein [Rhizomicrobium sp.]
MTAFEISQSQRYGFVFHKGDSVTVDAGAYIIDPSVGQTNHDDDGVFAGLQDKAGGNNTVTLLGVAEGFVGTWFGYSGNTMHVGPHAISYGYNCGVEFHTGHSSLTIDAGGEVSSGLFGVWTGAYPHDDYMSIDAGGMSVTNAGLIEGIHRDAIHFVLGGNTIANSGTIRSDTHVAIHLFSAPGEDGNTIVNSGSIVGGSGVAIVSGGAAMHVSNSGTIRGDIDCGAGNDVYDGAGSVTGTIFGGAGNDTLTGGGSQTRLCGGLGADALNCGAGPDIFIYNAPQESNAQSQDTIVGFAPGEDSLVVSGHALAHFSHIGQASALAAHGAAIWETSPGYYFLVIDANGVSGYQSGQDYIIALVNPQL